MIKLLNSLRLQWFLISRSFGFSLDYIDQLYRIYLNHSKIIHFRNGAPVYSLSTPALYSKPMINLMARTFYRTAQNKNLPNLLSFAVNDTCNANCKNCSFFNGVNDPTRKKLTLPQIKKIIHDAQEIGTVMINFVGGEPLLSPDLPAMIESVNKDLSATTLFTNGWFLEEKAQQLKDCGLDGVYVSLDSSELIIHDQIRGKAGLFKKAVKGIEASLEAGLSTGISMVIDRDGFNKGELTNMIEFGKKIGIHEILVFDAVPTGRISEREDLLGNQEWIEEMIQSVNKYNKDNQYPGILIYAYTTSHRSLGCNGGTSYCYISPYGDMMPCDFNHKSFGNVVEEPFYRVWEKMSTSKPFCSATWGGCKMKDKVARKKGYARTIHS
jgi:MoaA/NifB/PqqE/SkfB family radical SAM enzyme